MVETKFSTGFPEKLWNLHSWTHSNFPGHVPPWATCCSWCCSEKEWDLVTYWGEIQHDDAVNLWCMCVCLCVFMCTRIVKWIAALLEKLIFVKGKTDSGWSAMYQNCPGTGQQTLWDWQWSKEELLSLVEKNDKSKALKHKRLRAAAFEEFSALPAGLV